MQFGVLQLFWDAVWGAVGGASAGAGARLTAGCCLGRSSGGAVGGAGVQSLLSGVYAGVIVFFTWPRAGTWLVIVVEIYPDNSGVASCLCFCRVKLAQES